jgi:hypothetical protein
MIHHTTEMKEFCGVCNAPFLMLWEDATEQRGKSETQWSISLELGNVEFKEMFRTSIIAHSECLTKFTGHKPKSLHQLNEERRKSK